MAVADRVDTILQERGLSRRQLAIKAGIPPSSLQSALERGHNITLDMLQKIADALGVTIDSFLDIKPLPSQVVPISDEDKRSITLSNDDLEFEAFEEYLKKMGYSTFIDVTRYDNPKGKDGDVWIIYDSRENKCYSTTTSNLNELMKNIVAYTKFQVHELISKLTPLNQEAAEAQGEETVQFIERAITTQAERDRVQRIINKQSKKGGE